ncbi:universal stress protein [Mycobacterium sp.]|jgi:nucleotide-binding universal stress UspA family protein|uniref:universal stress protein n=1 Tax=Mycobacterium sp. TaxID=1785 RepID=UPI002D73BC20|nr:universal stress protein [Mycobacterium sp.]HZA09383.1 universal stress protein [Mycobacterium sp.]
MNSPSTLVVGVDGSAASDAAVRWAVREATMHGLAIKLINVQSAHVPVIVARDGR